jgi:hypothetical protein
MTPADEIRSIIRRAADLYGVPYEDITGGRMARTVVAARSEAIYQIYRQKYDRSRWSLVKIGKVFGVHHTAVRMAVGRAAAARGETGGYVPVFERELRRNRNAARRKRTKCAANVANIANVVDTRIVSE